MSELVTGDAVVLELRLARLASRGLAITIDFTLLVILTLLATAVTGELLASSETATTAVIQVCLSVFLLLVVPITVETLTRGRSLGKLALGLRVVRDDGGPIRFRHAMVRGLLGLVEFFSGIFTGWVPLLTSLMNPGGKRLGDLLAGTVVVRERMPVRPTTAVTMPVGLEHWAAGLDLTQLSDATAMQARSLLGRWHQLATAHRDVMTLELARSVAATVSPAPPQGVPPVAFLAAVMAERHRRELVRLGVPQAYPPQAPWGQFPQPVPTNQWQSPPATSWQSQPATSWQSQPPQQEQKPLPDLRPTPAADQTAPPGAFRPPS